MGFHDLNIGLPFAMLLSPICDCKQQCLFSYMTTSFRYYNPVRIPLDRCECASDNIHPFLTKCGPQGCGRVLLMEGRLAFCRPEERRAASCCSKWSITSHLYSMQPCWRLKTSLALSAAGQWIWYRFPKNK